MARPIRKITAEEENFRLEKLGEGTYLHRIRRDPVEPEPKGTIILLPFRITGYSPDCDGSLIATLTHMDCNGEDSFWEVDGVGLYPDTGIVVSMEELKELHNRSED